MPMPMPMTMLDAAAPPLPLPLPPPSAPDGAAHAHHRHRGAPQIENMSTTVKKQHLQACGWTVVNVPFMRWPDAPKHWPSAPITDSQMHVTGFGGGSGSDGDGGSDGGGGGSSGSGSGSGGAPPTGRPEKAPIEEVEAVEAAWHGAKLRMGVRQVVAEHGKTVDTRAEAAMMEAETAQVRAAFARAGVTLTYAPGSKWATVTVTPPAPPSPPPPPGWQSP